MKAKASKFFGKNASEALNLKTFTVTSKGAATSAAGKQVAVNVDNLERVASESLNRQRSLKITG
ncbi:hypothetical protein [Novosphingobium resinovorum]|uniref:hypothetical protein n=1 Tax=Novosphingobium resinovorum TaxID=158500 RepID=UPI002ED1330F|nr:hypothetical protein [Novosphingobium resinovorum]